jgi:hypothetical protein
LEISIIKDIFVLINSVKIIAMKTSVKGGGCGCGCGTGK